MTDDPGLLVRTRTSLHGVAELVLAGPQYRRTGSIKLRAAPGGFATVEEPGLAVSGNQLLAGGQPVADLSGSSYARVAALAGVEAGAPGGVYASGSGVGPGDTILIGLAEAALIARGFGDGDAALRSFAPAAERVLWPEHFDIAITLGEVNYGVSPGDPGLPEPYAYVGPWERREGPFWNAAFGAARPLTQLPGADDILRFFTEGRRLAHP